MIDALVTGIEHGDTGLSSLSTDQRRELYENGYLILKKAVSDELVNAALDRMHRAKKGEYLGQDESMTNLINASTLTPILHDVMGEFDPPSVAHIAIVNESRPSERFNSLGYLDKDTPYYGAITHMDGNITMRSLLKKFSKEHLRRSIRVISPAVRKAI